MASIASALLAGFIIVAGCAAPKAVPPPPPTATPASLPLRPGPNDPRIAYVTARLLEEFHYSQQRLDPDMSRKFFDGYLESLDQRHEHFLQPDLAGFARYRTNLDTLTIGTNGTAEPKGERGQGTA